MPPPNCNHREHGPRTNSRENTGQRFPVIPVDPTQTVLTVVNHRVHRRRACPRENTGHWSSVVPVDPNQTVLTVVSHISQLTSSPNRCNSATDRSPTPAIS